VHSVPTRNPYLGSRLILEWIFMDGHSKGPGPANQRKSKIAAALWSEATEAKRPDPRPQFGLPTRKFGYPNNWGGGVPFVLMDGEPELCNSHLTRELLLRPPPLLNRNNLIPNPLSECALGNDKGRNFEFAARTWIQPSVFRNALFPTVAADQSDLPDRRFS